MLQRTASRLLMLLLSLLICSACATGGIDGGSAETTTTGNVGTIVTKPKPANLTNIFPDFSAHTLNAPIDDSTAAQTTTEAAPPAGEIDTHPVDMLAYWYNYIFGRTLGDLQMRLTATHIFGHAVAESITSAGLEITDSLQSVTLSEKFESADAVQAWQVEFQNEPGFDGYVRFYFRNQETGFLQATYVVKLDDAQQPTRGILAFVIPAEVLDTVSPGMRVRALAFDYANPEKNLFVLRNEVKTLYLVLQLHTQCDTIKHQCTSEYLEIVTPPPARELRQKTNIRLTWNTDRADGCVAQMNYSLGVPEISVTYQIADTEQHACTPDIPFWGDHVFTASDLLFRYEDNESKGGTGLDYYRDGITKDGWNQLTPDTILNWLNASAF